MDWNLHTGGDGGNICLVSSRLRFSRDIFHTPFVPALVSRLNHLYLTVARSG